MWQFVAIRRASRGTIAKVLDTRIFDINAEERGQQNGHQRAITGPQTRRIRKIRKREAALSLEDAIEKYTLLYPEKDVRGSLSRMFEEGRLLLPPFIEEWLNREKDAAGKPRKGKRQKIASQPYTEADFEEWKATLHAPPNCTLSTADKQTEGHFRQYMLHEQEAMIPPKLPGPTELAPCVNQLERHPGQRHTHGD